MIKKKISKGKTKKKLGRPKITFKLDESDVTELASIGCTNITIASILKCSVDTLARNFAEACALGRSNLQKSILKTQVDVAIKDRNTQMLIWVGKQHCEQRDSRQDVDHKIEIPFIVKNFGNKQSLTWNEKNELLDVQESKD